MMRKNKKISALLVSALFMGSIAISTSSVMADDLTITELGRKTDTRTGGGKTTGGKKGGRTPSYTLQSWMHSDIAGAWADGYTGQGVTMTFVDDFLSSNVYLGNLGTGAQTLTHGQWTSLEGRLVAPGGKIALHDFTNRDAVRLDRRRFDVLNLSYGVIAQDGYTSIGWSARDASIIKYGHTGAAVIVKAAGNDRGIAVGEANANGIKDYLNVDLIGGQSVLFVGALSQNGSVDAPASMAGYSNIAGSNLTVQGQFLVVGVEGNETGLYGTSFAAPIVSGYSAILSSKFKTANATQVANRLLDTAREDTIANYDLTVHGQGEASLSRALAPNAIQ